ncbi:hypothetical protein KIW84_057761 [Lathyrus oleraceus]|uniref:Reverse transcriptase zinc-binding domain-containing protein n=1 Tax=Pisum sativum TaxID=3888 RepID=A0A9D4X6S3_PEA|nr:hypothetical protein KIW84_057761 [Pisum sativum]
MSTDLNNWFIDSIVCKLGKEEFIDFWHDIWLRLEPICRVFEPLYQVAELGRSVVNNDNWTTEVDSARLIVARSLCVVEKSNRFSVKYCYVRIADQSNQNAILDEVVSGALKSLWMTKTLSKFLIFGWRLSLNHLPTRLNLARCEILVGHHNLVCPLYYGESENSYHLFGGCPVSEVWWIHMCAWLQVDMPIEPMHPIDRLQALEDSIKSRLKVDSG